MRMLLLLAALILSPMLSAAEAGGYGSSRYGSNRTTSYGRYSQSHNRTDYANGINRYSRRDAGYGYTNPSFNYRYTPSYRTGYSFGRSLFGRSR